MALLNLNDSGTIQHAEMVLDHIKGGFDKAAVNAINRALLAGRTAASKNVRKVYTAKAAAIKSTLSIKKASSGNLTGEMQSRGVSIPLREFSVSPRDADTTGANRRRVSVSVKKQNRKALATGFISKRLKGNVFTRHPDGHIKMGFSVSAPQMLENAQVRDPVMDMIEEVLEKRMYHEVGRILQKG